MSQSGLAPVPLTSFFSTSTLDFASFNLDFISSFSTFASPNEERALWRCLARSSPLSGHISAALFSPSSFVWCPARNRHVRNPPARVSAAFDPYLGKQARSFVFWPSAFYSLAFSGTAVNYPLFS
ncbi:hypothetical protein H109_04042 [Trichophyton interdigitale MR816]|uniref:Uncharacterized protein n=1 Tax=Trichophyton interdigitale (strain MR816) TaxID=1215338 RepID=A0A059J9F1_TRIIM|nr:hypothetical protein H109_04042 [Trichophyton interdigitale MR816]